MMKNCLMCERPIAPKRLAAIPTATMCVECLEGVGDVDRIKRYDSFSGEELISTYFTENSLLEDELHRQSQGCRYLHDDEDSEKPPIAMTFTNGMVSAFEEEDHKEPPVEITSILRFCAFI